MTDRDLKIYQQSKEMDVFKRHEMKFLINKKQREYIESCLKQYAQPDIFFRSTICNVYYDTPDYRLIRKSIEKPEYKEKIRMRSYGQVANNQEVFLELKKKYDGVVYKRRIPIAQNIAKDFMDKNLDYLPESQIAREIEYFCQFYKNLQPSVYICYNRESYVANDNPNVRITFDDHICWRQDEMSLTSRPYGELLLDPNVSIMEIKITDSYPLWLVNILNEGKIVQKSFSKYGTIYEMLLRGGKIHV